MYENIIKRLALESRQFKKQPLDITKVIQAAVSLQQPSKIKKPIQFIQKSINDDVVSKKKSKSKIPIIKSGQTNLPTKIVDFQDGVTWL